jgi:general secretion pathway protein D
MNCRSINCCLVLAVSLFTAMSGTCAGDEQNRSAAAPTEFQVYHLAHSSPTEARRMLNELLGAEARNAQLVADVENSDLLVSGSPAIQQLSRNLVQQLNASPLSNRPTPQNSSDPWNSADAPRISSLDKDAAPQGFATRHAGIKTNTDHAVRFRFRNISIDQAEKGLLRLLGSRVLELSPHHLSCSIGRSRQVTMLFEEVSQSCLLEGSRDLVLQFASLLQQFEDARDKDVEEAIRFVSLTNIDPDVLNRAITIWKQTARRAQPPAEQPYQGSNQRRNNMIRPTGFQQIPGEPAIPIEPAGRQPADETNPSQDDLLRRPSSDITVEPLPDLDVLILRGRDPDVEELTRIIREIERLSAETAPEIEVVYLQNVQGEALNKLITTVLSDLTGPLQGRVSITPLVKPNALLLIGWGEAVTAAKKLIARLDESVPPQTQLQMFSLKHASASQVEKTVREFLSNRGGLGPDVNITADTRTNTLIVNAAPRDLEEVTRMIEKLDAGTSESVNQAKIIQLKNALAVDVAQTITAAIIAARGGNGTQRSAALEMLMVGPDGKSIAASGLLDDVKLTPDPRTNRIFITGPPDSLSLVQRLIESFDQSPAASAQIKVFQITNGDASDLVQVLRSLFPEQAAVSNVPQLATAEGESSLVPVRFSVDIRTNSIIATGTSGDLKIIEALLLRLDETDSQERVNEVYRLKNSPALDVANAVNNFLRSERIVNQAAPGRQNPFTQIESEVVVVPEPVGNALIISATPRYFEQIMDLVEDLDAQPPQVMIQVILAEVSLDNLHEFGVELGLQDSLLFDRSLLGDLITPGYNFNNQPLGNANNANSLAARGNVAGQGLSHFSLGRTNTDTGYGGLVLSASSENVSVLLRAMNQSRTVEILSRPQVMTLDNQPAFIQVGQRVPQITASTISNVGQSNSIELENVGLILGVTPRISPEGMVVMEIDAEKSEVGPDSEGIPVSISATGNVVRSPRINITTAQTTVSAASGQTIVIGGLITDNKNTISRRIPWLSDVPVLGNLFRYDGNTNTRKELLIILTPQVVRGRSEAEYIKQVELARMSWISCDIFDWLNTDTTVTGQLDSNSIQTIYPDQTPGAEAFDQVVPAEPQSGFPTTSTPARVVVPEWQIETNERSNDDEEIQRMSFTATNQKDSKPAKTTDAKSSIDSKKATDSSASEADSDINAKTQSKSKPKSFWSLR